ncbi:hypothetical protein KDM41_12560, partial [bacterium]|nr:hypothetical protein [bacterium]
MRARQLVLSALLLAVVVAVATDVPAAALNEGLQPLDLAARFPAASFDPAVPTIAAVTGVEPAARPLRPDEVVRYFEALAAASPRATLVEFGRTYEGRPLVYLAVSEPEVVADLEGFRAAHVARLDPRRGGTPAAADLSAARAVAWLAYGIHGDELSSTDAAAVVAYRLVAGTDAAATDLRGKLLVLIDPCENPDGRTRYLAQVTSFAHRRAQADLDDLAHRAVWPWGRGNHYLFDMNRDWITMQLPESARSREVARWVPQLLVDSHEMGANSTYLFPPPRHPFNPFLPANAVKWEGRFSGAQARALDARGYPYFNGEWNEEFFPGYGSSWAAYHGAIGVLYEMSRTTGTHARKRDGTLRTFAQAVDHQVTSSLANLASLAANAPEILADQIAARARGGRGRSGAKVGAWVFPPDPRRPGRLPAFARLLTDQGIEVEVLGGDGARRASLVDARSGESPDLDLPPGTLLVDTAQPSGHLVRALLDPHVPMNAEFFREEREYLEKEKGSRLYDTTAWSLPLLRGIPAYWGAQRPSGPWQAWQAPEPAAAPTPIAGALYYVLDGDPDATPAVLAHLLQHDVTVRVAEEPFAVGGRAFGRGAVLVQREGNRADLDAALAACAAATGTDFLAVGTADVDEGADL